MMKTINYLVRLFLIVGSVTTHAALLHPGDVLQFSAPDSYVEGNWNFTSADYDIAYLDAKDGLIIGAAQSTIPGIDQDWTSVYFSADGNHRSSSPITVIDDTTLDFSGWTMTIFGSDNYAFGSQQNIATYTSDGTTYTLDYYWDNSFNGGNYLGPLGVSQYHLHLTGTVVPIPAALWLFGSGLLGLAGIAKRKS